MDLQTRVAAVFKELGFFAQLDQQILKYNTYKERNIQKAFHAVLSVDAVEVVDFDAVVGHVLLKDRLLLQELFHSACGQHLAQHNQLNASELHTMELFLEIHTVPLSDVHFSRPIADAQRYLHFAASKTLRYHKRQELYSLPAQLTSCSGVVTGVAVSHRHQAARRQKASRLSAFTPDLSAVVAMLHNASMEATALVEITSEGRSCTVLFPVYYLLGVVGVKIGELVDLVVSLNPVIKEVERRGWTRPVLDGCSLLRRCALPWRVTSRSREPDVLQSWGTLLSILESFATWGHPSLECRLMVLLALCSALTEPLHLLLLPFGRTQNRRLLGFLRYCVGHAPTCREVTHATQAKECFYYRRHTPPAPLTPMQNVSLRECRGGVKSHHQTHSSGVESGVLACGVLLVASVGVWKEAEQQRIAHDVQQHRHEKPLVLLSIQEASPKATVTVRHPVDHSLGCRNDAFLSDVHSMELSASWVQSTDLVFRENDEGLQHIDTMIDAVNNDEPGFASASNVAANGALEAMLSGCLEDHPVLTEAASTLLKGYYVAAKAVLGGSVHATPRLLSSLLRCTSTLAVLVQSAHATSLHALVSIALVSKSLALKSGVVLISSELFTGEPTAVLTLQGEVLAFIRKHGSDSSDMVDEEREVMELTLDSGDDL